MATPPLLQLIKIAVLWGLRIFYGSDIIDLGGNDMLKRCELHTLTHFASLILIFHLSYHLDCIFAFVQLLNF